MQQQCPCDLGTGQFLHGVRCLFLSPQLLFEIRRRTYCRLNAGTRCNQSLEPTCCRVGLLTCGRMETWCDTRSRPGMYRTRLSSIVRRLNHVSCHFVRWGCMDGRAYGGLVVCGLAVHWPPGAVRCAIPWRVGTRSWATDHECQSARCLRPHPLARGSIRLLDSSPVGHNCLPSGGRLATVRWPAARERYGCPALKERQRNQSICVPKSDGRVGFHDAAASHTIRVGNPVGPMLSIGGCHDSNSRSCR